MEKSCRPSETCPENNCYLAEKMVTWQGENGNPVGRNGNPVEKSCYFLSFYKNNMRKLNKNTFFEKCELFS